ncbi:MAG: cyclase family protein [Bacteroidia bacterium]|nr:cyclase family protein [Bacteroidia bacterium]
MIAIIQLGNKSCTIDLNKPIDISIPLQNGGKNPKAWYAPDPSYKPLHAGDFTGSLKQGSPVNFFNVFFNPHGNGTHTECAGHIIDDEDLTINQCLRTFFFEAQLVSIEPEIKSSDKVITVEQVKDIIDPTVKALIIRTLPNNDDKLLRNYSGRNPCYLDQLATQHLVDIGIEHLLIDLPSVDRELDEGKLLSHHTFWQTDGNLRKQATITEFIYVNEYIKDGKYMLNLQITSMELDASPSKPVLYKIEEESTSME